VSVRVLNRDARSARELGAPRGHGALVNPSTNSQTGGKQSSTRFCPPPKRAIACLLIAFTAAGCSKAVEIPREEIQKPEYRKSGSYVIRLKSDQEYHARRFSVTDSTIVIEEVTSADKLHGAALTVPFAISRSEIASIAHTKNHMGFWMGAAIIGVIAIAIAIVVGLSGTSIS